jgi:hypothetical protein
MLKYRARRKNARPRKAAEANVPVYVCGHLADIDAHAEHSALERKADIGTAAL